MVPAGGVVRRKGGCGFCVPLSHDFRFARCSSGRRRGRSVRGARSRELALPPLAPGERRVVPANFCGQTCGPPPPPPAIFGPTRFPASDIGLAEKKQRWWPQTGQGHVVVRDRMFACAAGLPPGATMPALPGSGRAASRGGLPLPGRRRNPQSRWSALSSVGPGRTRPGPGRRSTQGPSVC